MRRQAPTENSVHGIWRIPLPAPFEFSHLAHASLLELQKQIFPQRGYCGRSSITAGRDRAISPAAAAVVTGEADTQLEVALAAAVWSFVPAAAVAAAA
jgi:hypothetical protein